MNDKLSAMSERMDRVGNLPFAGPQTFLRLPSGRDLEGVDLVVLGAPMDMTTCYRPGCRFGPRAIREMSSFVLTQLANLDRFCQVSARDYGDTWFAPGDLDHALEQIESDASQILSQGSRLLTLGGEHLITLPLLRAHCRKYGPLALLQFDSHSDLYDVWPRPYHGSVMAQALQEGLLVAERSLQVGLRSSPPATAQGPELPYLSADWLLENGHRATIERIFQAIGGHNCYLSYDIDFLDPAYAPATGTPVVGGPTTWQSKQILQGLRGLSIVGADVVELSPPYDPAGQPTALAAASMAYWIVELLLDGKK